MNPTTPNKPVERTSNPLRLAAPALLGVIAFHACWLWQGDVRGIWLPGLGVGIVLVACFGWRILPILLGDLLFVRWQTGTHENVGLLYADVVLHGTLIGTSWWLYHDIARGSRWLDDPRSVTIFLILIPGGLCVVSAALHAIAWQVLETLPTPIMLLIAELWLTQMVGVVAVAPALIVTATPTLLRHGWLIGEMPARISKELGSKQSSFGEAIELLGLTIAVVVLSLLHLSVSAQANSASWLLWASSLILLVWICIRQGLAGGTFAAGVTAFGVALAFQSLDISPELRAVLKSTLQGQLLAYCSTAMLVGVSASWIRASESRFRLVVSRIPFVVYSVRLPYGIPTLVPADGDGPRRDSKFDVNLGPAMSKMANVVLVSPACEAVLGTKAESLLGPFTSWMEHVLPEDHVLLIAGLAQICLQKKPVICEYRLRKGSASAKADIGAAALPGPTWVRDILTPHYDDAGMIDGWEGLVEDITEQRALSQNLRRMTTMLQVLISNLPMGVYFVQAPNGTPILVNARARVLLGQREDLAAGLIYLPRVYRLHKPDGTEYPWEELPVARALSSGTTCRSNDIIVHRTDGRKTPLITWAAPIDLHGTGKPDAAVWVLEDYSALHQAEMALRDSEMRLRAVIEAMVEGVILQDATGKIIDCNPSACAILGIVRGALLRQIYLAPDDGCVHEAGNSLPANEQPDRVALRTEQAVREAVLGLPPAPNGKQRRWLLVNSLPLALSARGGASRPRVVTTFADITAQMTMQSSLRQARDKYQNLVESLPVMVVQQNLDFNITFVNAIGAAVTGYSVEEMTQPGFCDHVIHPDDLAGFLACAALVRAGQSGRKELRLQARDGTIKTVLVFIHPTFEGDTVVGSTSLMLDLTMQRRLEQELQNARHLEMIGKLASGTVHDFNNLLTIITGMAGLTKLELPTEHAGRHYLARIEEATEQAAHLAGQLLTFSKQEPQRVHAVDLNTVVRQTLKLAKSVCPISIRIVENLADTLPTVHGEENKLKQVILNLCLNARDAMTPANGMLSISTDTNNEDAGWVHLTITDTGHGMAESVRSRIFEPFFSTKEHGTGLGLAVVHRIIHDFGGRIEVQSQLGVGTRFDIWLPEAQR